MAYLIPVTAEEQIPDDPPGTIEDMVGSPSVLRLLMVHGQDGILIRYGSFEETEGGGGAPGPTSGCIYIAY